MSRIEILNSGDHQALRLDSPKIGARHFIQVVAAEFATVAAHCPVIFSKNPDDGRFYAGAMLGFKTDENLLNGGDAVAAGFCPLDVIREGFFISNDNVAIDVDNPRFASGEPMFESDGAPSERLRQVQRSLGQFKQGLEETDAFIDTLMALKLIEPIDITLSFDDGERINLAGVYTVSLDALHDLSDDEAIALFRKGWLQLAYTMIGSLKQVGALAARRNRALATAG